MPAGISALAPQPEVARSFDHETKDLAPALTILRRDGLDSSSLPLLHVSEQQEEQEEDETTSTRNVVTNLENMRNVLSNDQLYGRRRISRSNEHLVLASLQSSQANPLNRKERRKSKSQDCLAEEKAKLVLSTEDFSDVLNAKLRRIQERAEQARDRSPNKLAQRKPFITTVKTGEFLMPPPEVAALLGIAAGHRTARSDDEGATSATCPLRSRFKPLVSLGARRPEVRHSSHNARCPAALKATVDFSLGMVNATAIAAASTLEERARTFKRNEPASPRASRALPKKLEPIEGMTNMLPRLRGDHALPFGNIMFDRRVVRGSAYACVTSVIDGQQSMAARQAEARRKHLARKRIQATKTLVARTGSPPPVPGRKHEPVQTETFLEELVEKPDETEMATQTDYYLEKPVTPKYCPSKIGRDVHTQIEPGELFDYDVEVQPILEVLVGKTIEQSLIEVLEEEEIAALKEQQRRFLELHAAEKAEERRLAEEERRRREQKEQMLKQQMQAMKEQQETEERIAAAVLLTGYIAELLPTVLEGLKMSGFLLDEIKADVEEGFMPWLMKEVKKEMGNMIESRELLMEIIREILEKRARTYRQLGEDYDAVREGRKLPTELDEEEEEEEEEVEEEEPVHEGGIDANFIHYETLMQNDYAMM